ncbi:MAG: DUF3793 family protein, partial [Butyrivibrio sp.]|nr:DUF3793 family protein [Butyrivibrio sp.]
ERMLLYVYRPLLLKRDMENGRTRALLKACGYEFRNVNLGVAHLTPDEDAISECSALGAALA